MNLQKAKTSYIDERREYFACNFIEMFSLGPTSWKFPIDSMPTMSWPYFVTQITIFSCGAIKQILLQNFVCSIHVEFTMSCYHFFYSLIFNILLTKHTAQVKAHISYKISEVYGSINADLLPWGLAVHALVTVRYGEHVIHLF